MVLEIGGHNSGNNSRNNGGGVVNGGDSVDHTTLSADSIGSVIGPKTDAFKRSLSLKIGGGNSSVINNHDNSKGKNNELQWDIKFSDLVSVTTTSSSSDAVSSADASTLPSSPTPPTSAGKAHRRRSSGSLSKIMNSMNNRRINSNGSKGVTIASIEGHAALSHICVGDVVTHINGVKIGPSYNSHRCYDLINDMCYNDKLKNNGILSIQTGNDDGLDTLLQATVLKPYPDATAKELGIEVWWWKGLVIREIKAKSLFGQSGLKMDDELESINGISLTYNDKITAKEFNRIVEELPCDITLVVKRSKHRASGGFK